jgi:conjugative transfer signal peptidase TraF
MQKANRIRTVIAAGLGIAALAVASCMKPKVLVLYNYTDSMPHGVYLVERREVYQRGDVVVFAVPSSVRALVNERHWLHENGFLMKPLIGLKGDSVSTKHRRFCVGGHDFGGIQLLDRQGLPLPGYSECGVLKSGFLVGVDGMSNSFDSRYFGPIPERSVIGVAFPLWLF